VSETNNVKPLYDYGKLYSSHVDYSDCYPSTSEKVIEIVKECYKNKRRIRIRGSGHTFNGCTLPTKDELLVRTDNLNWFRYEGDSSITVGAGALVWDIRDLVEESGFQMPVYNGGWAGPTLGGYINAGGFGKGSLSETAGGLWENIISITFVDGTGEIHTIQRDDKIFQWLFSSYGQLGIIIEAKLKLAPTNPLSLMLYPKDFKGRVPKIQIDDPKDNDFPQSEREKILFWFSLLISKDQEKDAWQAMLDFTIRNQQIIPNGGWAGPVSKGQHIGYRYDIKFHTFNPPLLFPKNNDFIVMGVMSFIEIDHQDDNSDILKLEADFIALAKKNNFKLYLQAENIGRNIDYQEYYGKTVYQYFKDLKERFDPLHLINAGNIFPIEDVDADES